MKEFIRFNFCRMAAIAVWLFVNIYLVGCRDRTVSQPKSVESSKTTSSYESPFLEDTTLINQGKLLFKDTCGICHAVWKTDNYLAGIVERLGRDYLKIYITKQDSLLRARNEYTLAVKRSYGNFANVHNYKFSNEQLNGIIAYLKKYSP